MKINLYELFLVCRCQTSLRAVKQQIGNVIYMVKAKIITDHVCNNRRRVIKKKQRKGAMPATEPEDWGSIPSTGRTPAKFSSDVL